MELDPSSIFEPCYRSTYVKIRVWGSASAARPGFAAQSRAQEVGDLRRDLFKRLIYLVPTFRYYVLESLDLYRFIPFPILLIQYNLRSE